MRLREFTLAPAFQNGCSEMTDLQDPSLPIKNQRHELYAIQRAKGVDQGTAWKNTVPFGQAYNGSATSLRVSGHRAEKRPEVQARIRWHIAEARSCSGEAQETFERSEIIQLNLEVSEALQAAYERAVMANVPPQRLEQLRTVFASHLGRQGKLSDEGDEALPDDEATAQVAAMVNWMHNLGACTCQTR